MNDFRKPSGGSVTKVPSSPDAGAMLFRIIEVADEIKERVSDALAEIDLSYPKYEVLEHLLGVGEPVSLGALAEDQCCARSNITQLVDRLEGDGLVRRVADSEDRRSIRAELTAQGAIKAQEGALKMEAVIEQLEASLTDAERTLMRGLLGKLS